MRALSLRPVFIFNKPSLYVTSDIITEGNYMQKIIGLLGVKGSGKDTAASFLIASRGYRRIGFADALYREAAVAFGVTVEFLGNRNTKETPLPELALANCTDAGYLACVGYRIGGKRRKLLAKQLQEPRSPRFILQFWGTEYRREGCPSYVADDNYWLNIVEHEIRANPEESYAITDVRFPNELQLVWRLEGIAARIRRLHLEAQEAINRAAHGTAAHASETAIMGTTVDAELINEEGASEALRDAMLALDASLHEKQFA